MPIETSHAPAYQPTNSGLAPTLLRWRLRPADLFFYTLLVLHLIPIWWFRYFPTQDGPNHLYCANLLRVYHQAGSELFHKYYTLNAEPNPNWLGYLLMAGLGGLTGPLVAEKVLLTIYLLLLPLGMRALLRAVRPAGTARPAGEAMVVLVFPFLLNWPYHMGFYNYLLGLGLMLVTMAWWLRHFVAPGGPAPRPHHAAGLALLMLLLYACHLTALVLTGAAIGTLGGWWLWLEWRKAGSGGERANAWRTGVRPVLFTLGAFVPVALLAGYFLGSHLGGPAPAPLDLPASHYGLWKFLLFAYLNDAMVSYSMSEAPLAAILGVGVLLAGIAMAIRRLWRWRTGRDTLALQDGLALVAVVWYLAYHFAPAGAAAGTFLYHRLGFIPYLALVAWLGATELPRPVRLGLMTLGTGLALALLGLYSIRYSQADTLTKEYVTAAEVIRPGSVILPLNLSSGGVLPDGRPLSINTQPFLQAGCYVALARGCVNLGENHSRFFFCPTRFRPALDPRRYLGNSEIDTGLARLRFFDYAQRTGGRIDDVLVWDNGQDQLQEPQFAGLRRQLEQGYRLIFTSRPRGLMRVYAPKE